MTEPITLRPTSRRLPTKDCLPKRKRFVPTRDKKKENSGHQQNVSIFWQNNRSVMALCFVGGYLVLWNQGEYFNVMKLKSVANVSIKHLGKFHGQHSNVSPKVSKKKAFKLVIRHASKLCWVGASSKAVYSFKQVAPKCQQLLQQGQTETEYGINFGNTRGCLCCQEVTVAEHPHCFYRECKNSVSAK